MKKAIIILAILVATVSCSHQRVYNLQKEDLLKIHFSDEEIISLSNLLLNFENYIFTSAESDFNKEQYLEFLNDSKNLENANEYLDQIRSIFPASNKIIEKNCGKMLVEKIWILNEPEESQYSQLNYNGEYFNFLKNYVSAKNDSILLDYFKAWEIGGDLCPPMTMMVKKNLDQFNFQDETTRLILAIHFITLSNSNVNMNLN
ncbi:hypothetical protein [uncultured Draconibacterium sp.]|uniref:hypothetical protein n=1 Tax=uncultured Draconibacterium sp. TaxID=1573823 RepID=UPI0032168493